MLFTKLFSARMQDWSNIDMHRKPYEFLTQNTFPFSVRKNMPYFVNGGNTKVHHIPSHSMLDQSLAMYNTFQPYPIYFLGQPSLFSVSIWFRADQKEFIGSTFRTPMGGTDDRERESMVNLPGWWESSFRSKLILSLVVPGERGVQRITNHERANNLLIEADQLTSPVPAIAYQSLNQTQQNRIAEHQSILEEDAAMARDERGKKGKLAESVNAKLLRLSSEGVGSSYKIPKRRRSRSSSRGRRSRSRGRRNRSKSSSSSSRSRSRGRRSRTRSRSRRRRRTRSRSPDSSTARIKKKFQEDRPNRRWTKKYDLPLPKVGWNIDIEVEGQWKKREEKEKIK